VTGFRLPVDLQAILFDKDGTLIDYERTWAPINMEAARLAAAGDEKLAQKLLRAGGVDPQTGRTRADSLFASGNTIEIAEGLIAEGSPFEPTVLTGRLDALFRLTASRAVPLTDLPSLFSALRASNIAIGIASSDSEAAIRTTVRSLNISELVGFVCGYDSGHGIKPEPGMVQAFCAVTGSQPSRVAVIGDNRHDMVMARAAGAIAVAVLSGTGTKETLKDCCDVCIAGVDKLPALLAG
jgi:phosphoglycolate phosphatase